MKSTQTLLFIFLFGLIATAHADKNDTFYVQAHGRFYIEAVRYLNQGMKLAQNGDKQGARFCFDAAIRIDKGIWPAYLDRAQIFFGNGQLDLALQDCNTASRLRPDFYRTFILRARIYRRMGRCREALADVNRIFSFHGYAETDALALSERALLRATCRDAEIHDPKLALADAQQACSNDGWNKAIYMGTLAIAYAENGDFANAISSEQRAIDTGRYSDEELRSARQRLSRYQQHQKS
jgi:tetratricopeptide (TPR) repeat protein